MDAVDLKSYIIENNKIEDILISLGCHKIKRNNNEIRCALPKHNNPTSVCIKIDTLSVIVYSDSLSSKGDIFTFIMDLNEVKFFDAFKYVHEVLELEMTFEKKEKPIDKIDVLSVFTNAKSIANAHFDNFEELEIFSELSQEYIFLPHIEWVREGIMPYTCERFNIGYDIRTKRILIPHRLWCGEENDYVGLIGRTTVKNFELFDIPKYFPLKPYKKSLNVYGLQENYKSIQKAGYVVVYESEKSVLKRHSKLDETGVAICGHSMSFEQARILTSLNVDIIIAMDKDVNLNEIRGICEKFYGIRNVYYMYDKYDVLLQGKESPADKINKYFYALMKTKILYNKKEHDEYIKYLKKGD